VGDTSASLYLQLFELPSYSRSAAVDNVRYIPLASVSELVVVYFILYKLLHLPLR
jgi:hypothetical protein